jgi:tetratricopeptide (TPR) repeat protein
VIKDNLRKFVFCFLLVLCASFPGKAMAHEVKVCLAMLVKEEVPDIEKCLTSVIHIVDCICICDGGASQDTLSFTENRLRELSIPFRMIPQEPTPREHQRTFLFQSAQRTLSSFNFNLEHSYVLILDPEMQLVVGSHFQKTSLIEDAYSLFEHSFPLSYSSYQIHLLRASLPWASKGTILPEWSCGRSFRTTKLLNLKVEERENAITAKKFENDLISFHDELLSSAEHVPSLFRLAQIHRKYNRMEQAISLFEACLRLQGRNEESWFLKYMIGDCYEKMGKWDQALFWFLESYQEDPLHAEPLLKIAHYYRLCSKNNLAYLFAKHGSILPQEYLSTISPIPPFLHYQFDEELSIAAYYTPFKKEGFFACDHLILTKNVPSPLREQTYRNLLFYVQSLPDTRFQSIHFDLPLIQEGSEERYHPMNPSLQKTPNGYQVLCRTVNYTQTGAKFFQTIEQSGIFRTKNFLLEYDRNFQLLSQKEIIENLPRKKFRAFNLDGLDDCRLFYLNGNICFTCTTMDTNPAGTCQISFCQLATPSPENKLYVEQLVPLKGPDPYRCEKNWLPFVQENQLCVIYSYDPLVVYQIDTNTGQCTALHHHDSPFNFSSFRGSAGPIALGEGYLVLVHEVVHFVDYQRCYLHRFLFLDRSFKITHLSKPFYFLHLGIEYCCGMTLDHSGDQLIIGVGQEDHEAYLCSVPIQTIRSLLECIP